MQLACNYLKQTMLHMQKGQLSSPFQINLGLNSSTIDELGEGAYESGWWCQAKCEPRAGYTGIHSNHHQAPSHWETQWRYLQPLYSPRPTKREESGWGKLQHKSKVWSSKELHDLLEWVCVIWSSVKTGVSNRGAWSTIKADQHWLNNFNLASMTFSYIKMVLTRDSFQ